MLCSKLFTTNALSPIVLNRSVQVVFPVLCRRQVEGVAQLLVAEFLLVLVVVGGRVVIERGGKVFRVFQVKRRLRIRLRGKHLRPHRDRVPEPGERIPFGGIRNLLHRRNRFFLLGGQSGRQNQEKNQEKIQGVQCLNRSSYLHRVPVKLLKFFQGKLDQFFCPF